MTRATLFMDAFWEQDITSTRGLDILSKRMKDGKKICKEIEDYFKERAKVEQSYSKGLLAIAKKLDSREELGDLGMSIRELKTQTEKVAEAHDEACQDFTKLQREVNQFSEDQKQVKQEKEDRIRQFQAEKLSKYKQMTSQKDKYTQKCKENESAEDAYFQAKQNVNTTTKDLMKFERNKDKASDQMNNADVVYKSAVASLETARKNWEREMEEFCKTCQHLEEERIDFMRDRIWKSTNVDSQTCVDHDEVVEKVRRVLENCDITQDIQEFIEKNKLSGVRPAPIPYEAYHRRRSVDVQQAHVITQRPPLLTPIDKRAPPPRPDTIPYNPHNTDSSHFYSSAEGDYSYAYSEVEKSRTLPMTKDSTWTLGTSYPVQKSYTGKGVSELTVIVGDTVEMVRVMAGNMVQVKLNGKCGLIPVYCLSQGQATYL